MKYKIGDFVKDSNSKTLLIIATREQNLDFNYLKNSRLKIKIEFSEDSFIAVEKDFDYKVVEVKHFEKNSNLILDKQSNFSNCFEDDLSR